MNTKQLNVFKIVLFVLGLAIVGTAFVIMNYPLPEEGLPDRQKFFWLEVLLCYLVFFIPFFFSSIALRTVDTKITSTVHIWISVVIFEIVAISLTVLSLNGVVKIRYSVLAELVLFFLLSIFVYFGYFAGNHIGNVQAEEKRAIGNINELKSAFEMLSLKTDMWGDDFSEHKAKLKKLCDDVRYMSPVDSGNALNLEKKLVIMANVLAEANFSPSELNGKIAELTNLVSQRKLLKK